MLDKLFRRWADDDRGATAIYVAATAGVMFAAGAVAIDLSRFYTLHTELQHAADAAALAGAAELDGDDNARVRATEAANGAFGTNRQTFGMGTTDIAVAQVRFFSELTTPGSDPVAGNDGEARYIEVTVETRQMTPVLRLAGGLLETNARAIAGFNRVACKIPPFMICNPYEPLGGADVPFEGSRGQQILVKSHQGENGGQWSPGTFGLLDPPTGSQSAKGTAEDLAKGSSPGCYGHTIGVRPGQVGSVRAALNTRFDMYENPFFNSGNKDPLYRPAKNVTKGFKYNCGNGAKDPTDAKPLPRDTSFANGRIGNGQWDLSAYWAANHGGSPPVAFETRYDAYRWEIDNNQIPGAATGGTSPEEGKPQCHNNSATTSDNPDRRLVNFAVVNCRYYDVKGNYSNVTPVAFVEAFLTEPVSDTDDTYLEILRIMTPQTDSSVMHDVVQLYR